MGEVPPRFRGLLVEIHNPALGRSQSRFEGVPFLLSHSSGPVAFITPAICERSIAFSVVSSPPLAFRLRINDLRLGSISIVLGRSRSHRPTQFVAKSDNVVGLLQILDADTQP